MLQKLKLMSKHKFNWRGFTLQFFVITIFPLTTLLLIVAFGSQSLHREAMRNLIGDRDLRTVRSAAGSVEQQIEYLLKTIELLSRDLNEQTDFSTLILTQSEIDSIFDGGLAVYSKDGGLISASRNNMDWEKITMPLQNIFLSLTEENTPAVLIGQTVQSENAQEYFLIATLTNKQQILIGAFSAPQVIKNAIGELLQSGQATVLVVSPGKTNETYETLYQVGNLPLDKEGLIHPGIKDSLNGESGINYYQGNEGEHVIAFAPIPSAGWGLVSEEAWENIASPYLNTTQYAPLTIVPLLLLTLLAIWFGARRIVQPLQKLEKQAAQLAKGDFVAIQEPVGGIEEIQNLQRELVEMAYKLNAAQQNLRSYIGAITEGIESERRNLAREIHDDTIQSLIALNQRIQIIRMKAPETQKTELEELLSLMKQTMENLRRMIRGLRPIYLEDLGLVASLEMLVSEMEQVGNIPIKFSSAGKERRFGAQIEMSLYRMVQESLNNVLHHANAKHAWVTLNFTESETLIKIRDDGKGFSGPTNPAEFPKEGHFGLLGLQERSELINAELDICSTHGEGTTISICLPNLNICDHP